MSSVEVLGPLDGYPPLLTIDEAAQVLRIGRSLGGADKAALMPWGRELLRLLHEEAQS